MGNSTIIITVIALLLIFPIVGGLISYFTAKRLVIWTKNVQIISKRKDLEKSPKLKEIIRLISLISNQYHLPMPEIGVYPSREINAFATGRLNDSLIAFSSGLINAMESKEIKGVVAHEMAHLINYDLKKILLFQGAMEFLLMIFNFLLHVWVMKMMEKKKEKGENNLGVAIICSIIYFLLSSVLRMISILIILAFIRSRELKADRLGAKIAGVDTMIGSLKKLISLEKKDWIVDGVDLSEADEEQLKREQNSEPTSIQVSKFNPQQKKNWLLDLFRTHPPLEERIDRLERLRNIIEKNKF